MLPPETTYGGDNKTRETRGGNKDGHGPTPTNMDMRDGVEGVEGKGRREEWGNRTNRTNRTYRTGKGGGGMGGEMI